METIIVGGKRKENRKRWREEKEKIKRWREEKGEDKEVEGGERRTSTVGGKRKKQI